MYSIALYSMTISRFIAISLQNDYNVDYSLINTSSKKRILGSLCRYSVISFLFVSSAKFDIIAKVPMSIEVMLFSSRACVCMGYQY